MESDSGVIFHLPLSVSDVSFADFCDFKESEDKSLDKHEEESETKKYTSESLQYIIEALGFIIKEDLSSFTENDILYCYKYINDLVSDYKPVIPNNDEYIVNIDNVEYVITKEQFQYMKNESLTVLETIEFLEVTRWVENEFKNAKEINNLMFNLGLAQLSIILRKRGEALPISKSKRDSFIEQRKLVFQNVSLDKVLDVRAFFLRILTEYSITALTSISLQHLKHPILAKVLRENVQGLKLKKKRKVYGTPQGGLHCI